MLRGVLGSVPSCREVGAVARLPRRIVGTLGGVDPADTALADLIAGQSEERRLEMEEVAAGISSRDPGSLYRPGLLPQSLNESVAGFPNY